METTVYTLEEHEIKEIKVNEGDLWVEIGNLYCINDLIEDRVVIIDSLFGYIGVVKKKNIKSTSTGIYTNTMNRYSCPMLTSGQVMIKKDIMSNFIIQKPKRSKLYFLSVRLFLVIWHAHIALIKATVNIWRPWI